MTTSIKVNSFFKKVTKKESAHYGDKRPDLEWYFTGYTGEDMKEMSADMRVEIATIVNDALENYGKKLLLQNGDDWQFVPSDERVNISNLYRDITSETTRKRTVTKESLAKAGAFYAAYAAKLLDKSQQAANAGEQVIAQKLVPIAGKPDALNIMSDNILALVEKAVDESDHDIKLAEDLDANAAVLEWVVSECAKLATESQQDLSEML